MDFSFGQRAVFLAEFRTQVLQLVANRSLGSILFRPHFAEIKESGECPEEFLLLCFVEASCSFWDLDGLIGPT